MSSKMRMEIEELERNLLELPQQIKEQELRVLNLTREVVERQRYISLFEASVKGVVSMEKDEQTGKNKFPNETLREAEVQNRLANDEKYEKDEMNLSMVRNNLKVQEIELRYLLNFFSGMKVMGKMRGED